MFGFFNLKHLVAISHLFLYMKRLRYLLVKITKLWNQNQYLLHARHVLHPQQEVVNCTFKFDLLYANMSVNVILITCPRMCNY